MRKINTKFRDSIKQYTMLENSIEGGKEDDIKELFRFTDARTNIGNICLQIA